MTRVLRVTPESDKSDWLTKQELHTSQKGKMQNARKTILGNQGNYDKWS